MKQFYGTFAVLLISTGLSAQITITNADMPDPNDTLRYSIAAIPDSLDYLSTGPNYTWDFSNLSPVLQGLEEYKPAIAINVIYNLFFGLGAFGKLQTDTLDLGVVTLTDVYDFYNASASVFKITGRGYEFSGVPTPVNFQDDDEIYMFPLQYNDHDSSTFSVTQQLPGFGTYVSSGSRVNDVDGWGSITTPFGNFNALRVATTIYQKDSIYITQFSFGFSIDRVIREYKWLASGAEVPVLQVTTNEIFGFETVTEIRYKDVYQDLSSLYMPLADFVADDTVVTDQDTVNFTNLTNYYPNNIYQWTFNPNTMSYRNGTNQLSANPSVQFNAGGYYTATLRVINPYGQDTMIKTNYILVVSTLGEEIAETDKLMIYPNPATDRIRYVTGPMAGVERIRIVSAKGEIVYDANPQGLNELDIAALLPGQYYLVLYTGTAQYVQKFLKQ